MQINERIVGDVALVEVTGNVVANRGEARLKDKINSLGQQGYRRVVVDLGGVSHMDSAGLGDLIQSYSAMKQIGGAVKLMRLTRHMQDLLIITKLATVFDTYEDETAAIASFSAAA